MSWKCQREFVECYVKYVCDMVWGGNFNILIFDFELVVQDDDEGLLQFMNCCERCMCDKENKKESGCFKKVCKVKSIVLFCEVFMGFIGQKRRVVVENGKIFVVDFFGDVYFEEEDKEGNVYEFLFDVSFIFVKDQIFCFDY